MTDVDRLEHEYPNASAYERLSRFYRSPTKDPATVRAIGYKTENYLHWSSKAQDYVVGEWYEDPSEVPRSESASHT